MAAIYLALPQSFSGGFRVHTELVWGVRGGKSVREGKIPKLQPVYQKLYYTGAKVDKCNQYLYKGAATHSAT
jgi:hypothetical protein